MEVATKWKKRAKRDRKNRWFLKIRNKIVLFYLNIKDNLNSNL